MTPFLIIVIFNTHLKGVVIGQFLAFSPVKYLHKKTYCHQPFQDEILKVSFFKVRNLQGLTLKKGDLEGFL